MELLAKESLALAAAAAEARSSLPPGRSYFPLSLPAVGCGPLRCQPKVAHTICKLARRDGLCNYQ